MHIFFSVAAAATVSLHVGIHRDAGAIQNVAVDGASGQCTTTLARITCPVNEGESVHFRWGPGGDWEVSGTTTLTAELDHGVAWVLAPAVDREEERAALESDVVSQETIERLFIRTGSNVPPIASMWMYVQLFSLKDHVDPRVRRALVEALFPLVRDTPSDPLPPEAPELVPPGLIGQLARDPDVRVRRKTCALLREVRRGALASEVAQAYEILEKDPERSVRKVCLAAMAQAPRQELMPAVETWQIAMRHLAEPKGPGRAAAATLAKLAGVFQDDLPEEVDPVLAVRLTLVHHPEKAWTVWRAWRERVPFRREWVDVLLRNTEGLSQPLIRRWALTEPVQLADALYAWEPEAPHTDRYELIRVFLERAQHPRLREVLDGLREE